MPVQVHACQRACSHTGFSSMKWALTHKQYPGPLPGSTPAVPAGPAAPPEAHRRSCCSSLTISSWVCQTWADLAHTLSLSPSLLPCPALPSWAALLLLLLFSHPAGHWPAQWEGEELRAAALSQLRGGNQPLLSFQKLSLWSWAHHTHSDARCVGGQGFQRDL